MELGIKKFWANKKRYTKKVDLIITIINERNNLTNCDFRKAHESIPVC